MKVRHGAKALAGVRGGGSLGSRVVTYLLQSPGRGNAPYAGFPGYLEVVRDSCGVTARLSDRPLVSVSKEFRSGLSLGRMDRSSLGRRTREKVPDKLKWFGRSRRLPRSGRSRKQACNLGTGLAEVGQHEYGMRTIDIKLGRWYNPK
jgi:hypothetical protein